MPRSGSWWLAVLAALGASAPAVAADGVILSVEVTTDLTPAVDFVAVRSTLTAGSLRVVRSIGADPRLPWSTAVLAADYLDLSPGPYLLTSFFDTPSPGTTLVVGSVTSLEAW